jgi:hypothetical protein
MAHQLITKKLANALIANAAGKQKILQAAGLVAAAENFAFTGFPVGSTSTQQVLKNLPKMYGGLWVGGTLSLFDDSLQFVPNAMNKALQAGSLNVDIPLRSIQRADWRFGFVTGIIDIVWTKDSNQYLNSFRCFGSKALLGSIQTALQTVKTESTVS